MVVQHAAKKGQLRHRRDEDRSIFSGTARTPCACFFTLRREAKVRRLLARGKSENEAEQLVDSVDRERADFIQKYFRVEWPDRAVYHAMINTAIGDEAVVHTILEFMNTLGSASGASEPNEHGGSDALR